MQSVLRSIVSDRDEIFVSSFWNELFSLMGSELMRSSAFYPQTNGKSKVINNCVKTYLLCFFGDKPSGWYKWLPWAEYNYNTSFHTTISMSLFKIVHGREPPLFLPYEPNSTANFEVEKHLTQRDATLLELKEHL